MSTLKCQECGHENETQRVYCHSCGARLDRSTLVEEAKKPQKPVKPQRNGQAGAAIGKVVKNLFKTALFAFIVACLVEAARPPIGVPTGEKDLNGEIVDAPSLSLELEEATAAPKRFGYTDAQLNAYLKNRTKPPKNPTLPAWALTLDSAFVNFNNGSFRITKKFLVLSQPIYVGGTYLPTAEAGVFKLKPLSGHVGSLPLPGLLFDQVDDFLFDDFAKNMKEEASAAGKMQSFAVTPKMVIITSGGARK